MPAMYLPQNANALPFVQLYVELPMKHHTGAFFDLDNATLVLVTPGPVYIICPLRANKKEPLVGEVELLQEKPHYAHVRYPNGKETSVATKHLTLL